MTQVFPLISIGLSMIIMIAIAAKWNLPIRSFILGAFICAILAYISFLRIFSLSKTNTAAILSMSGQTGLTLGIAFVWLMLRFWRDPERVPFETEAVVLSPADGRVKFLKYVEKGMIPSVIKDGRTYSLQELYRTNILTSGISIIGVEMNLLDVHVNRCPISVQVRQVSHIDGKFLSLRREEAPFVNERCTTLIENDQLTVATVQVASRLVHRIDNYLCCDETVRAGQKLGMIHFGSLMVVVLPNRADVKINVKVGNYVEAGISILARYG